MVKVTIGNNLKRQSFTVNPKSTIREVLEETQGDTGIDYTRSMLTLDGAPVNGAALDKTFADMGYTGEDKHDTCYLLAVVKADNAR